MSIKRYDFKPGLPVEFEIIPIAELYKNNKSALIAPHRANFYHILWIEKGSSTHLIDFKPVQVKSGSLLFVNKGNVHLFDKAELATGQVLLFTDSFFSKNSDDARFLHSTILFHDLLDNAVVRLGKNEKQFHSLVELMKVELKNSPAAFQHDVLQNLVHNFLLLAEREKRKQGFREIPKGADLDYTFLFNDFLESDFTTIKSVSAYADKIHISEKRLNQATSKILGKTPKELIDERVLLEVKRLLVHGHQTIKEIGFTVGFDEPTNFIKYFRKHTGKTPIEFREAHSARPE